MGAAANDVRAIFYEALERQSPEDVAKYLDDACANDDDLRRQVEGLLAAHRAAKNFLGGSGNGDEGTIDHPLSEAPGTVIGRYKLLQQIGEGGFGVVFLAEQERPVKRRVALKIIKPGMDTCQVIARFEAERQALAMMDHPNIAKVHDAGTTEAGSTEDGAGSKEEFLLHAPRSPLLAPSTGRPYFVMELVQGVPITEYCDQCNLTTDERLALFVTVCQAVQHAHQKGVIHRDIKPTNVLVAMQDGQPAPKIIDFGVAKAINQQLTEHTLLTAFAQMVGTPLYMSPEQAELSPLGVDTRSDIYSLGVLLYELLTGTTPFDKDRLHAASYDGLRRIICEEEPPRPSARISTLAADVATTVAEHRRTDARRLRQTVRGELDWIVMKCLEKDRNRRYETPNSLARDIERYLHDEPVQACPPSIAYRVSKFVRRNKVAVLAASAIVVSLTIASALSTWLYLREREARRQAEFGAQIYDVANPFHSNSQQEAQQSLASLAPQVELMDPQNRAKLYYRFGDLRGRQGRWKESATYFAKGLELEPNQLFFEPYHYYLPALIQSGDVEGYQRLRQELIRRFGSTTDPRIAECVLKDCLITPWPDANFEVLERLANTALHAQDHWAWEYFQFANALFEYRRANYESAVRHTLHTYPTTDPYLIVSASMVRAMAHQQLGEAEDARRVLSYGLELAQARFPREARLVFDREWNDWIFAHALMDEASALIDRELMAEVPRSLATSGHPTTAVDNLYFLALEERRSGNEAAYRKACRVLALVPDSSGDTVAEFRRTWTWCLGPHSIEDLRMPLKHAEQFVANNSLGAHYAEQLVLGAMLYRIGQYETSAQHLEASIAAYPGRPPFTFGTAVYPRLLLSMVKLQLGDKDEARRLFAETQPAVKVALESPSTMWEYRTTVEVLRREAEALIGRNKADKAVENKSHTNHEPKHPQPSTLTKQKRGR